MTLPNAAHYQLTSTPTWPIAITWNPATTFNAGPGNDTIIIPAGQSSGIIDGDAGTDKIKYAAGALGSYRGPTGNYFGPTTFGNYTFTNEGFTTDSAGAPGVKVLISNPTAQITDTVSNVEFAQAGVTEPLADIQVFVDRNDEGGGFLWWDLNGVQQGGDEHINYDPTLPIPENTYSAIYRTGAANGNVIELSDYFANSNVPGATFIQIHGGASTQNSAGCIVGDRSTAGTPLNALFKELATLTSSATPTTTKGETFYRLPIPIEVDVMGAVPQPTLDLSSNSSTVTQNGNVQLTISVDNFPSQLDNPPGKTTSGLDRDITVQLALDNPHTRISLTPNGPALTPINGRYDVTIPVGATSRSFYLDAGSAAIGDVTADLVGYQTTIPGHATSKPSGQLMINPATSDVTIGINPAPQMDLLRQYMASAFHVGDATLSTSVLSDVHATPTTLLTTPGHA